jgi:hypothetical protein
VSESNPIRVFVTHAFQETDDYLRVFEFLESVDRFFYLYRVSTRKKRAWHDS